MTKGLKFTITSLGIIICVLAGSGGASAKTHRRTSAARHASPGVSGAKAHVETWAFDDGCAGGAGASTALVRRWLTFAESDCGPGARKAYANCHAGRRRYCEVMEYLDTDWTFTQDEIGMASAAFNIWSLHEPSPHQGVDVTTSTLGGGFLLNQTRPGVQAFFRSYARRHFDTADGLMMDWQSPSLPQELYYSTCGCTKTMEIHTNAALRAEHAQMSAALTHRNGAPFMQADNSLSSNPYLPQGLNMLDHATGVDGLVAEGEPESTGVLDPYYSTLLDQMAYIDSRTRSFLVLMSKGVAGAGYESASRRVQEATILLGFRPGQIVDWADLEVGNRDLAVWPEEGIYPTAAVETMRAPAGRGCLAGTGDICTRGGHNSLQVAAGVYRREFRACYSRGRAIGPCAAIVNTTGGPVTVRASWLRQRRAYHHEITFSGGDVQSGGTVDLAGAPFQAGASQVASDDALLLVR